MVAGSHVLVLASHTANVTAPVSAQVYLTTVATPLLLPSQVLVAPVGAAGGSVVQAEKHMVRTWSGHGQYTVTEAIIPHLGYM